MATGEIHHIINHFSHKHPLELTNLPRQTSLCSGCKLKACGWVYSCKTCNFNLHTSCSKMPKKINHPCDTKHPLILSFPIYPGGAFLCNACGREGSGLCYHCKECSIDIHILCSVMPLSVSHVAHPHPLNLSFSPPYANKSFTCDVCNNLGSNHWLYMCNQCEFDAHLSCAISQPKKITSRAESLNRQTYRRPDQGPSNPPDALPKRVPMQSRRPANERIHANPHIATPGSIGTYFAQPARADPMSSLMGNMMQGFGEGVSQQMVQSMMQGLLSGGGGGIGASPSLSSMDMNQLGLFGGGYPLTSSMGLMPGSFGGDTFSPNSALAMVQGLAFGGGGPLTSSMGLVPGLLGGNPFSPVSALGMMQGLAFGGGGLSAGLGIGSGLLGGLIGLM